MSKESTNNFYWATEENGIEDYGNYVIADDVFFLIPNKMRYNATITAVFFRVRNSCYLNWKQQGKSCVEISISELAKRVKRSKSEVAEAVKRLVADKFIIATKGKGRTTNKYVWNAEKTKSIEREIRKEQKEISL